MILFTQHYLAFLNVSALFSFSFLPPLSGTKRKRDTSSNRTHKLLYTNESFLSFSIIIIIIIHPRRPHSPTVFLAPDFHGSGQMTLPSFFSPEAEKGKSLEVLRRVIFLKLTVFAHHLGNAASLAFSNKPEYTVI